MTTNNHPAHGPVSLDLLHQIREHLQHDTQYSNGGNRAYILADVLKVIDGAIAAFGAEPAEFLPDNLDRALTILGVALPISKEEFNLDAERWMQRLINRVIRLESELIPPAPVVPTFDEWLELRGNKPLGWVKDAMRESYDACRAAMLHGKSDGKPELTVWYGAMPETNGKTNWTAILHRKGQQIWEGITIDRSEYPDRVRYEADRMRHLIGELPDEPDILSYDADAHSGYVKLGNSPVATDGWVMVPKEMTPEMMRAVQIKSELGGYAASELSGAYDMFAEFWDVAVSAAPQQEVK